MLQTILVAASDRARLTEIGAAFGRFGLQALAQRIGLDALLGGVLPRGPITPEAEALSEPARLRLTIESLGPTFIKLAQILATRGDLLGPEWVEELERLHSDVAPEPWPVVRDALAQALGRDPREAFAEIDESALAAGSMAQVHRAILKDGEKVIVKVRRPAIRETIEADMRLLGEATRLLETHWPDARRYNLAEMAQFLKAALFEESDFTNEGRNCERVAQNLNDPNVKIPKIHWAYSSAGVLVQEFIEGYPLKQIEQFAARGLDRKVLAERGADAFIRMALVNGEFHADPHPGNLMALPNNVVAFIDFGMIGFLSAKRRGQLVDLVSAVVSNAPRQLATLLIELSPQGEVSFAQVETACELFVQRAARGNLQVGDFVAEFLALLNKTRLSLPSDLALFLKALVTADGVLRMLDPQFDIIRAATPYATRSIRARYAPQALGRRAQTTLAELDGVLDDAPATLKVLMRALREGRAPFSVDVGVQPLARALERAGRRVALALVVGAFALGLTPIIVQTLPTVYGMPLGLLLGVGLAALGVIALMFME